MRKQWAAADSKGRTVSSGDGGIRQLDDDRGDLSKNRSHLLRHARSFLNPWIYTHSSHQSTAGWILIMICTMYVAALLDRPTTTRNTPQKQFPRTKNTYDRDRLFMVSFGEPSSSWHKHHRHHKTRIHTNVKQPDSHFDGHFSPNYGGLNLRKWSGPVRIQTSDPKDHEKFRETLLDEIDHDIPEKYYTAEEFNDQNTECRRPDWTGYSFPTCNTVHESPIAPMFQKPFAEANAHNVTYLRYVV